MSLRCFRRAVKDWIAEGIRTAVDNILSIHVRVQGTTLGKRFVASSALVRSV